MDGHCLYQRRHRRRAARSAQHLYIPPYRVAARQAFRHRVGEQRRYCRIRSAGRSAPLYLAREKIGMAAARNQAPPHVRSRRTNGSRPHRLSGAIASCRGSKRSQGRCSRRYLRRDRLSTGFVVRRSGPWRCGRHGGRSLKNADLAFLSLADLSRLLAARKTSSREIVDMFLARIAAIDGRLHAYIDVYDDEARALAKASDLERDAGVVRGPLHGLPIALKDLLHFAPHPTTAGSKSWLGRKSDSTASVVARLIAAGMIPLGKTHMVEFAFGGWGRNEPMGAPWNPWDLAIHRVAGGSSSGSAVAVAAGLAPVAIGSDTGGSIRIPAALCGLTGLKPTYGIVSLAGVVPLATTLDSVGPLTRTVDDAALLLSAIAGPDPADPATLAAPRLDFGTAAEESASNLKGVRIAALAFDHLPVNIEADVVAAYAATIELLRHLGAYVDEGPPDSDCQDVMVRNGRFSAAPG